MPLPSSVTVEAASLGGFQEVKNFFRILFLARHEAPHFFLRRRSNPITPHRLKDFS
jgi:hypothetical protein